MLFSLEKLGNIKLAEFEEVTQSVDSQVWTKVTIVYDIVQL